MFGFIRKKIELKVIVVFVSVVFVPILVISYFSYRLIVNGIQREIQQRIASDLNVAVAAYDKIKNQIRYVMRDQNERIKYYFDTGNTSQLAAYLNAIAEQDRLDLFVILNKKGRIVASSSGTIFQEEDFSSKPQVQKALTGVGCVSTEIVKIKAPYVNDAVDGNVMMIQACVPVTDVDQSVIAIMMGGYILNGQREIADIITQLVGGGTSIFQQNRLISTNISEQNGPQTKTIKSVPDNISAFLAQGKEYIGQDRVLGTHYMTGYTPLRNADGDVVGSIYIQSQGNGFVEIKKKMLTTIVFIAGLGMLLSSLIGFGLGHPIVRSIAQLQKGAERVSHGNFDYKIKVETDDELKDLADSFNAMTAELKETEKKLIQSEKMAALGQIAAAVSHELKNPLAGIKMAAFLLKEKCPEEDEESFRCLKDIETETERANKIVMEILSFAQPITPVFNPVYVNDIIRGILSRLENEIQPLEIKIIHELTTATTCVNADQDQLRQVFDNLIMNSVQAMVQGGELTIRTEEDEYKVHVKIKDTGVGIPEENLKNIFQPFFTTKEKGIGLGLAIVQEIVKKHQGTITVESQSGQGSVFIVSFPKHKVEGESSA